MLFTVLTDGLYTPWRGHQRHGRPHLCPDCGSTFADTEHMMWDCEKMRQRRTTKQRWVFNMRQRAKGQTRSFWNCGLVPANWIKRFESAAMQQQLSLELEPLEKHGTIVWVDGGCASQGIRARAGFGVFWGSNSRHNEGRALEGLVQTAQRAEVRALARVLQRATRPVVVVSDSANTVSTVNNIKDGREHSWAHGDLWRFIATREKPHC